MSELPYVPTTADVRREYRHRGADPAEFDAAFNRWLARERAEARRQGQAEAWDEAVASAHLEEDQHFIMIKHDPNPYRDGAGQ